MSGLSSFWKERLVIRIHFMDTSHPNNKQSENRLWDGLEMFLTHWATGQRNLGDVFSLLRYLLFISNMEWQISAMVSMFCISKTSSKRILRVKLLYRRAFIYSLKVVTKNSQHLVENLTILAAFHVKTDIIGDKKESYNI